MVSHNRLQIRLHQKASESTATERNTNIDGIAKFSVLCLKKPTGRSYTQAFHDALDS